MRISSISVLIILMFTGCASRGSQYRARWAFMGVETTGPCGSKAQAIDEARFSRIAWGGAVEARVERCEDAE